MPSPLRLLALALAALLLSLALYLCICGALMLYQWYELLHWLSDVADR